MIKRRVGKFSKKLDLKAIIAILFAILVFISIMAPKKLEALSSADVWKFDDIKLVTNSHAVIERVGTSPQIVPGESKIGREERIAAEAAAEAKRQQEAIKKREILSREYRAPSFVDPVDFNGIYARAGEMFGIDPKLLKAIHIVETGASGSTVRSNPSGATGPMQFLPSTFRNHAVDGNGDGHKDIASVEDSIFSAAKYLKACGYPDLKKSLWGYNPSTRYFNKVTGIMASL